MTYKTLMLKIYKPSKKKREIMLSAAERYAKALQQLLDHYREKIDALAGLDGNITRTMLLNMIEKEILKELNLLEVQPFKDSLKIEFAALAMNYIVQHRKSARARYPRVYNPTGNGTPEGNGLHPLYFGRYDTGRDFCLLTDRSTGRFYAKLYLLNAKNKMNDNSGQGRLQLRYISSGPEEYLRPTESRRFLILPLAFGKHQLRDLNRVLQNPKLVRTARLKIIGNDYYLLVNVACEPAKQENITNLMGISRCTDGGLHYTVCDNGGRQLESGLIPAEPPECQKPYLFAKKIVGVCRKYLPQVILEANGGKNDKLLLRNVGGTTPLTNSEYSRLVKILAYKLSELGLATPVLLSANRLFTTCPECQITNQKSRISSGLFVCVECGYASEVNALGSLNLIRRLKSYQNDCVPFELTRNEDTLVFQNRILGFECPLTTNTENYDEFFHELSLYLSRPTSDKVDCVKYAIIKKLRAADRLTAAIRIIETQPNAPNK